MNSQKPEIQLSKDEKEVALKILKLPANKRKRLLELEMQRRGLPTELEVTPEQRKQMISQAKKTRA